MLFEDLKSEELLSMMKVLLTRLSMQLAVVSDRQHRTEPEAVHLMCLPVNEDAFIDQLPVGCMGCDQNHFKYALRRSIK